MLDTLFLLLKRNLKYSFMFTWSLLGTENIVGILSEWTKIDYQFNRRVHLFVQI